MYMIFVYYIYLGICVTVVGGIQSMFYPSNHFFSGSRRWSWTSPNGNLFIKGIATTNFLRLLLERSTINTSFLYLHCFYSLNDSNTHQQQLRGREAGVRRIEPLRYPFVRAKKLGVRLLQKRQPNLLECVAVRKTAKKIKKVATGSSRLPEI